MIAKYEDDRFWLWIGFDDPFLADVAKRVKEGVDILRSVPDEISWIERIDIRKNGVLIRSPEMAVDQTPQQALEWISLVFGQIAHWLYHRMQPESDLAVEEEWLLRPEDMPRKAGQPPQLN